MITYFTTSVSISHFDVSGGRSTFGRKKPKFNLSHFAHVIYIHGIYYVNSKNVINIQPWLLALAHQSRCKIDSIGNLFGNEVEARIHMSR